MLESRAVETRTVELYRQSRITGGCYTGIGNEATSVGSAYALAEADVLVPTHRDMGAHLVRGHTLLDVMRQYLKRSTAQTEGKDSSLHLGREGSNIVGMISHLAHMMPVAVGVALAERQKAHLAGHAGEGSAVLTTVGDGSTSLGDFHESLNFAAVQRLPVVFVIVNNQYAYSTPTTLQYACERLSDRAAGYGMPGEQVDGTDVTRVLDATRRALSRGRRGEGPTLLECVTMRMRGHSEHDDFRYVPKELVAAWEAWDPVERMRAGAIERGWADPAWIERVEGEIAAELEQAIATAEDEPAPEPEAAGRDVYRAWQPDWTAPGGEDWELGE
jgi:TPP-dependent pyruvate/acetoin dehydrogenase alpha subunit